MLPEYLEPIPEEGSDIDKYCDGIDYKSISIALNKQEMPNV